MQSDTAHLAPHKQARYQPPRHAFDRRSRSAKRYAALIEEFSAELGEVALTEATRAIIRQLAGVVLQSEATNGAIVRGETVDAEQLVRLANLQTRLMRQLGIGKVRQAPTAPDLATYLAGKDGKAA